ncbi:MAG: protein-glutamate O-methyltransferase CheR [Myxococcales bacterium]|nr:protein-glutamate O-methyltransferase CheR [Myxococcales bacterium]
MSLPRDIVAGLRRRLTERAGLELPAWVVEARARARMTALGLGPAAYLELVNGAGARSVAELGLLVEAVRVGETRFFRHRSQIDALADVVAPALAARGKRAIRAWSAGCASGEEPYTMAIVLARALPEHAVTIVATDVSEEALAVAARGRYPRAALAHVPEPWRDAFVDAPADGGVGGGRGADDRDATGDGGEVQVRPELARRVTFERRSLLGADAPRGCDLIWCRNVLIYFAPEARRRAVARLVGALEPGGWLFVGYSEHLRDVAELEPVRAGEATIYVRRTLAPAPTPTGAAPPARAATPARGVTAAAGAAPRPTAPPTGVTQPAAVGPPAPATPPRRRTLVATGDCATLARDLGVALGEPGLVRLEIELDGASLVPDEVAVTLRRARAAAAAAGVTLVLRASRAGTVRWLRRHGLEEPA